MDLFAKYETVTLDVADRFLNSSTSKGNQIKWFKDGKYFKADSMGYEGLAEEIATIVSKHIVNFYFTEYKICKIYEDDNYFVGCYSKSFLGKDESYVSFARLIKLNYLDYNNILTGSNKDKVISLCNYIKSVTSVSVLDYLSRTIYLDSIILNEDRHLNNLGIIKTISGYRLAPCFDNGLSLLSDLNSYNIYTPLMRNVVKVKSKPITHSFEKQVEIFNDLDCEPLIIDYDSLIIELENFTSELYDNDLVIRCKQVIKNRLHMLEGKSWKRL